MVAASCAFAIGGCNDEVDMGSPPSIAWLLLVITCVVACLGLNPKVRRDWRWGRTATSIPMSTFGAVTWMAALAFLTASAFGAFPIEAIFLPLPVLLCAALHDSWRDSRAKKAAGRRQATRTR